MDLEKYRKTPDKWADKVALLRENIERACDADEKADKFDNYQKFMEFANNLKEKYPNHKDYRLYHFLIGSTPNKECAEYDFPGEDSIENLLSSY